MSQHSGSKFGASSDFTDREDHLKVWRDAVQKPQVVQPGAPDAYRILAWSYQGGQGASRLLSQIRHEVASQRDKGKRTVVGFVDFENVGCQDSVGAMLKLRSDLIGHVSFGAFDTAFVESYKMENPRNLREAYSRLTQRWEGALGWTESIGGSVPGVGVAAKLVKEYLSPGTLELWKRKNPGLANEIESVLSGSVLRERLSRYFGYDLQRALSENKSLRIVLIFDHHHALNPGGMLKTSLTDLWLRSLIAATPGALVVICSRMRLQWDDSDDLKNAILPSQLEPFGKDEAIKYLTKMGVEDAALRTRIIEGCGGLPYYLARAVETFKRIRSTGREPQADDFPRKQSEFIDKLLDHLSEGELNNLWFASYPETIDEELFLDLLREFPGHLYATAWARFSSYTFVRGNANGSVSMDPVIRDGLQERQRRSSGLLYRRVHRWLHKRYEGIACSAASSGDFGEKPDQALIAAAKHLALVDPAKFSSWIFDGPNGKFHKFSDAHRWRALSCVYEIAAGIDGVADDGMLDHHYANVLQWMGHFKEARRLFESALEKHKKAAPDESATQATIVHALADVYWRLGEANNAAAYYAWAKELYDSEPGPFQQRRIDLQFSCGLIHDSADDHEQAKKAETYYHQALELNREIHENDPILYARFLVQLGQARVPHGRIQHAKAAFSEAIEIFDNNPDDEPHKGRAPALLDLARCDAADGDNAQAEARFEQAVAIFEKCAGKNHPNTCHALHHQAALWCRGDLRLKEGVAQLDRAVRNLRNSLGGEHEWTKEAAADLEAARARVRSRPRD